MIEVFNRSFKSVLIYEFILVTLIEGYLELYVTSLLNVKNLTWDTPSEAFSSIFALCFALSFTALPTLIMFLLKKLVSG